LSVFEEEKKERKKKGPAGYHDKGLFYFWLGLGIVRLDLGKLTN